MNVTPKELAAEQILKFYGYNNFKILPAQRGYRNQSFPVILDSGKKINLILYKIEHGILHKIKSAKQVSEHLVNRDFPARRQVDERIVKLNVGRRVKYGALYDYIEGETIAWESYTKDHIKLLGKTMSDMHASLGLLSRSSLPEVAKEYRGIVKRMERYFNDENTAIALDKKLGLSISKSIFDDLNKILDFCEKLNNKQPLHMDFVRSNILFQPGDGGDKFKYKISGILDFEKAAYGHPVFDIARTLSFLLVDCKYKSSDKVRKYFLHSGYNKRGKSELQMRHVTVLNRLVNLFLFYDFYKFLRHNPYEFLPENEHFVRTLEILKSNELVVPTTSSQ